MDKLCFLIPSTSHMRNWNNIKESYLYESLKVVNEFYQGITIFIFYEEDDILYHNQIGWLEDLLPNLHFRFILNYQSKIAKGNVVGMWNFLYEIAYKEKFNYFYIIGDDISYPKNNVWLPRMIHKLRENNNLGFSAGDSGNPMLPMTQFLVSRKHYEIFNHAFNKLLVNWYCDNYMCELYPKKYINYFSDIKLINSGGTPRYIPQDHNRLYKILVKRDRHILKPHLK